MSCAGEVTSGPSWGFLADRYAEKYGRSYPIVCGIGALFAAVFFTIVYTRDLWLIAVPFLLLANISTDMKNGPNFAAAAFPEALGTFTATCVGVPRPTVQRSSSSMRVLKHPPLACGAGSWHRASPSFSPEFVSFLSGRAIRDPLEA